jgi:hypothetical protein
MSTNRLLLGVFSAVSLTASDCALKRYRCEISPISNTRIFTIKESIPYNLDTLDRFEDEPSHGDFVDTLNSLANRGLVQKWNSTLLDVRPSTTIADVQLVSRTCFSTGNYFQDIIDGAVKSQRTDTFATAISAMSGVSILLSSIIIPQLSLPDQIKSYLGVFFLVLPFVLVSFNIVAPRFYLDVQKWMSKSSTYALDDRILYHEAGHFLAGYLCGVPVTSYDISGDIDAGTTIDMGISKDAAIADHYDIALRQLRSRIGNLLVVSMSGVVAESLRFGNSKGGAEDLTFATSLLRIIRVPESDREGCLRWAVMKALVLLRIHRDSLDSLANAMREGRSISDCIRSIEADSD